MIRDPLPVAAAVPSSLLGALFGSLLAGRDGFLVGGIVACAGGVIAVKLLLWRARELANVRR